MLTRHRMQYVQMSGRSNSQWLNHRFDGPAQIAALITAMSCAFQHTQLVSVTWPEGCLPSISSCNHAVSVSMQAALAVCDLCLYCMDKHIQALAWVPTGFKLLFYAAVSNCGSGAKEDCLLLEKKTASCLCTSCLRTCRSMNRPSEPR